MHDHAHRGVAVAAPGIAERDEVLGHVADERNDHERGEGERHADVRDRAGEAGDEDLRREGRHDPADGEVGDPDGQGQLVRVRGVRRARHVRLAQLGEDEERSEHEEADADDELDVLTVDGLELGGRGREQRDRHEGDHAERGDAGEQAPVEAQRLQPETRADARQHPADAAEQHGVAEQRADDRVLDDIREVRSQREDRDRELGDVAECRLQDPDDARREPPLQRVRAARDDRRDEQQGHARREGARGCPDRMLDDEGGGRERDADCEERPVPHQRVPSPSVAISASASCRIGLPVFCDAVRRRA